MVTHGGDHPYAGNWWPDAAHHWLRARLHQPDGRHDERAGRASSRSCRMPDFEDAYKTQQVLEAAMVSAKEGRTVKISEIK